ncbi:helix-turn-helix domain-containing protein [Shewanella algae]|uniref:helix-turn-helix domain-containing protein n=1 Tax=Shewanella algae TaxID=38313 RepID=UPI0016862F75|nr:helix-turn-helix transcriptional regulator [Shewanella algae]MBO2634581.1 helix-turn-helix transcriptional regulator [Shewanella algae]QNV07044.1 XRE family transcriptional regulator [Shewanella algae]
MSKKLIVGVASTIRRLRKAKGLSQEELAERANLDRTYISGIERGVRNITLESLELIVFGLDMNIHHFLKELEQNFLDNRD